ncbi:MAG: S-layer homology domain-containing protein, partial [Bacteroidia bacterium]|nr:S-layer homology domain-containing protein [Bacteroidia bacterium]
MKNFILSLKLALVGLSSAFAQGNLDSGLVAKYYFNGNANDESGNGNNGTVNGATLTTDRFGNANSAYSFDGVNNYVSVANQFFDNGWSEYTISGWFNSNNSAKSAQCFFNTIPHNGTDLQYNYFSNNKVSFFLNSNPGVASWDNGLNVLGSNVSSNSWYHYAFIKSGDNYKFYLNGNLDVSYNGSISPISYLCGVVFGSIDPSINLSECFSGKLDDIRIYNCALSEDEIYILADQTSCEFSDCNSTINCGVNDSIAYEAVQYLCGQGIIHGYQATGTMAPTAYIQRQDLAKILFKGLYCSGYSVTTPADNFPTPYSDLQTTGTLGSYHRYARVLCYLEYDNGKSVFDRNFFNFRPTGKLQRMSFLKALLETWNILPDTGISVPFADVSTDHPSYGYLAKAYSLSILDNMSAANFRPSDWCTREEAFIMLYKIMTNSNCISLKPTFTQLQDINNYFVPGLYTTATFGKLKGMEQGNFNHYTKTSFTIADIKHALNFEHTYNSYTTELPDYFYPQTPLGKGWSHTYNSYILFD